MTSLDCLAIKHTKCFIRKVRIQAQLGRPLKFQSVEELETQINLYFDDCDKHGSHDEIITDNGKSVCMNCWATEKSKGCLLVTGKLKLTRPYTVTGLALWLDTTRQTLLEYQGEVEGREHDPAFADTIRMAKQRIENFAAERLLTKTLRPAE